MKRKIRLLVLFLFAGLIISCSKSKSDLKDNDETAVSGKTENSKLEGASLRLRVLDSVLKIMKKESPYPNDMEVLSMKEVDSITNSEVAERSLRLSKGASVGTSYYVDPRITPALKKIAMDKSILGYVLHYKLRYRINDMRVDVKDFVVVIDAAKNEIMYSDDYLLDHDILVHQLMMKLENYLLNTIK